MTDQERPMITPRTDLIGQFHDHRFSRGSGFPSFVRGATATRDINLLVEQSRLPSLLKSST